MTATLIQPLTNTKRSSRLPLGTKGEVLAIRDDSGQRQYLVKFKGYGNPLHCEASQVKVERTILD